jgi:osmotically-inducible protein OsmY
MVRTALTALGMLLASNAWAQQAAPVEHRPPTLSDGAGPTDQERARAVEAQLSADPMLRDNEIAVEVSGKRIRLAGTVDSSAERARAQKIVEKADPTLTVENLLRTPPPPAPKTEPAPADKASVATRRAAQKAEKAATEVGAMVTDGWITSKVKAQLMATDGVHASAIDVQTADHIVTLRGHVQSETERSTALDIARHTRGVERVIDELAMLPKP